MANKDLEESVTTNLRSVIQSCKGGVPFDRLQRDYRDLLGSPIPFRDLGFNSLEGYLRSIPSVIRLNYRDGQLMAESVPEPRTIHIVKMVDKQKSDTRKRGFHKPPHAGMRVALSSRARYYNAPRSTYSNYNSSASHYPARSSKPRQFSPKHVPSKPAAAPPAAVYHSKPIKSSDQVPYRSKYDTPPRFKKKQEQSQNPSPPPMEERVPSPLPFIQSQVRNASSLSTNDSWDVIPPPMIPPPQPSMRPLPSRPRHMENNQTSQLNSLESTRSAKEFVDVYSKMNGINADYKTLQVGQKAKNKGYVSTLCLGDKKYQSYPELRPKMEEAEEEVAKKAMEDVKKTMQEHMNSLPETPYGTTEEIRMLLGRIEEIVCEKPSGMFENGIVQEYESKFKERLPPCWPELLRQSSFVEIDEVSLANGRVPKGANFIVRPTKELSSGNRTPSSTSSKTEFVHDDLDTCTLKKNLVDISHHNVPDFILPSGNIWDVYVTNVSGDISVRLLDYHNDFLDLSNKMKEFYKMTNLPVTEVYEYQMYAACVDNETGIWHRVLVEEKDKEDGKLICYFVDEGEFLYVEKENLQEIKPSFLKLPFQAIHINMDELEAYDDCIKYEILKDYVGETLIAEVKRGNQVPDFFPDIPGIHRTAYTVVLYDTSDSSDDDLNLNNWLKESIEKLLVCKLPKLSTSSCAYLSHVTADGHLYLRFAYPQESWIEKELDKLFPVFEEAASFASVILTNTMCVAKFESGTWHRATISENQLAASDSDMIEVFFVDYGHSGIVGKSEICELEPISEMLASIPPQAVCCELLNALPSPTSQWTEAAIAKLIELAPFDQELIIRVMDEADENNLAKVNLFKRNKEFDIVSINGSLSCTPSLFHDPAASVPAKVPSKLPLQPRKSLLKNTLSSAIPDVAVPAEQMAKRLVVSASSEELKWLNTPDDIKSPGAFDVQAPMILDIADVPSEGQYFDVFVTMAAHPHNFVVQPLNFFKDLDKLRADMQKFYSADENQFEIDISMLRKNNFYAALHSDGTWYRVRIEEIILSNPVEVAAHYVDFGDFAQVNISNLQPLYQNFRALPCQAVQASLSGVRSYDSDWNPVHCVEFQKMVTEKEFVSVVRKKTIKRNNEFPTQCIELILIDTKSEKDIFIHELLIERKMARPS